MTTDRNSIAEAKPRSLTDMDHDSTLETSTQNTQTLREALWLHPTRVWSRSTRPGSSMSRLADAAIDDIKECSPAAKATTAALGLTALTTQGFDRVRIVVQKAPPEAIDRMVSMGFSPASSFVAAGIVSGAFAMWNFLTGEALNRAIERFPNLTENFVEQFPRVTKVAQNAVPKDNEAPLSSSSRKVARVVNSMVPIQEGSVSSRLKRGGSGVLLGSTIFVGTAATRGVSANERTKINAKVTRDASTVLFGFTLGVAEAVRRSVLGGNLERAQRIIENAGSSQNWNRVSAAIIIGTIGLNAFGRKSVTEEMLQTDED